MKRRAPDASAMAGALRELLAAAGLDLDHPDLAGTPERVARTWLAELLDGLALDPAEALGAPVAGDRESDLVLVEGLRFHGLCPHHLLPFRGVAAVAYQPAGKLAGFGGIARLVQCFTHRPTLQERATVEIAEALGRLLGARGAACALAAHQTCLALPGETHDRSRVVTVHAVGGLAGRADVAQRLIAAVSRRARRRRSARSTTERP